MATIFHERKKEAEAGDFDRHILDSAAVKAAVRLMAAWNVGNGAAAELVGVGARTWSRIKAGQWPGALNQDQRMRISGLVGLYQGLHVYFGEELADDWVSLGNDGPVFKGEAPLRFMLEGGIPAILRVRDYVDALRGGL